MKYILETKRLKLRELNLIDAKDFYDLNSNTNVIKYTGNSAFNSINEAKQFIGGCGLKLNSHETDIGFRFFEEEWNKGYATESAIACLNYGFKELNIRHIIGRAVKKCQVNKCSRKDWTSV